MDDEIISRRAECRALRQCIGELLKCSTVNANMLAQRVEAARGTALRAALVDAEGDAATTLKKSTVYLAGFLEIILAGNWHETGLVDNAN